MEARRDSTEHGTTRRDGGHGIIVIIINSNNIIIFIFIIIFISIVSYLCYHYWADAMRDERTRHRSRQRMEEKCAAAKCVFLDKLRAG